MTTNLFSPLFFVAVFGSRIRDPGWVKIRIRDKHPGSATTRYITRKILPHSLNPSYFVSEEFFANGEQKTLT
jgi:hypothetical protein